MKALCLDGKRFGLLSVIGRGPNTPRGNTTWLCSCECGKTTISVGGKLSSGEKISCGCKCGNKEVKSLVGERFGRVVVVSGPVKRTDSGQYYWTVKCDCGEVFDSRVDALKKRTLGCKKCQSGPGNPMWKAELTDEHRSQNRAFDQDLTVWKSLVFQRDGYACQVCFDRTGGNLNAHHLYAWSSSPDKRYDLDNGITLCDTRHRQFHMKHGYGGNTEEQFIRFLYER